MEVTLEFISFESVSWETKVLGGGSDDEGPSGRRDYRGRVETRTPARECDGSHMYLTSV